MSKRNDHSGIGLLIELFAEEVVELPLAKRESFVHSKLKRLVAGMSRAERDTLYMRQLVWRLPELVLEVARMTERASGGHTGTA